MKRVIGWEGESKGNYIKKKIKINKNSDLSSPFDGFSRSENNKNKYKKVKKKKLWRR